jgi:hypothetical protein
VIATSCLPAVESIPLDAILADALALNWSDLMPKPTSGLIHVEYHVDSLGSVEFVKVWASTVRGHWNLICECWMHSGASHQSGLHFSNSYESAGLDRMFGTILQHEEIFLLDTPPGNDRMIQVYPPTDADRAAASKAMEIFRDRLAG